MKSVEGDGFIPKKREREMEKCETGE